MNSFLHTIGLKKKKEGESSVAPAHNQQGDSVAPDHNQQAAPATMNGGRRRRRRSRSRRAGSCSPGCNCPRCHPKSGGSRRHRKSARKHRKTARRHRRKSARKARHHRSRKH